MPNYVTNLVTFGSDSVSLTAFQQMAHDMGADGEPLGSFDFNKLIPMPKELDIEEGSRTEKGLKLYQGFSQERAAIIKSDMSPVQKESALAELDETWRSRREQDPAVWKLGELAYSNLQKYGHATWYKWCVHNWGTKWNAVQCNPIQDGDDTMGFLTAWSSVPEIMKKLSEKYPEQTITYRWADENVGYNVGEMVLKGGEIVEEHIPEPGSREAYEMVADIMGMELSDFDLYLNQDGTNYEYRAEPHMEPEPPAKGKKKSKGKGQER